MDPKPPLEVNYKEKKANLPPLQTHWGANMGQVPLWTRDIPLAAQLCMHSL